jgi:hypothetical protein
MKPAQLRTRNRLVQKTRTYSKYDLFKMEKMKND